VCVNWVDVSNGVVTRPMGGSFAEKVVRDGDGGGGDGRWEMLGFSCLLLPTYAELSPLDQSLVVRL